jgi:hypothetical protein
VRYHFFFSVGEDSGFLIGLSCGLEGLKDGGEKYEVDTGMWMDV